jgi:hypothetical protein
MARWLLTFGERISPYRVVGFRSHSLTAPYALLSVAVGDEIAVCVTSVRYLISVGFIAAAPDMRQRHAQKSRALSFISAKQNQTSETSNHPVSHSPA